jgi:hypothetical protein
LYTIPNGFKRIQYHRVLGRYGIYLQRVGKKLIHKKKKKNEEEEDEDDDELTTVGTKNTNHK